MPTESPFLPSHQRQRNFSFCRAAAWTEAHSSPRSEQDLFTSHPVALKAELQTWVLTLSLGLPAMQLNTRLQSDPWHIRWFP